MYLPTYNEYSTTATGTLHTGNITSMTIDTLPKTGYLLFAKCGSTSHIIAKTDSYEAAMQLCNSLSSIIFGSNLFDEHPELLI